MTVRLPFVPRCTFRNKSYMFTFLEHIMRAIVSARAQCSHRCVSLRTSPVEAHDGNTDRTGQIKGRKKHQLWIRYLPVPEKAAEDPITWWTFRIFLFFLLGGGEGGSPRRRGGRGTIFLLKIPGWRVGGRGGEGPRGCLRRIWGGGLKLFFGSGSRRS